MDSREDFDVVGDGLDVGEVGRGVALDVEPPAGIGGDVLDKTLLPLSALHTLSRMMVEYPFGS